MKVIIKHKHNKQVNKFNPSKKQNESDGKSNLEQIGECLESVRTYVGIKAVGFDKQVIGFGSGPAHSEVLVRKYANIVTRKSLHMQTQ